MILALVLGCADHGSDTAVAVGDGGDSGDTQEEHDPIDDVQLSDLPAAPNPCRAAEIVLVTWVVDGDTAYVESARGEEKVRFIGVDTPETTEPADCYGEEAKEFTIDQLSDRRVWLTFDEECLDVYDRTLAYIHTGSDTEGFFERRLLLEGYAVTLTVPPNDSFAQTFAADEAEARSSGVGMWSACR